MVQSNLQHDLRVRTHERMANMVKDTLALYEMVDLDWTEGVVNLVDVMLATVATLLACSDMPADIAGARLTRLILKRRENCKDCDCDK